MLPPPVSDRIRDLRAGPGGNQADPPPTIVYWPLFMKNIFGQADWVQRSQAFAIRSTRLKTAGFMQDLQQAVWRVNRGLPLADVRTLTDIRARSMAQTSFMLVMLAT